MKSPNPAETLQRTAIEHEQHGRLKEASACWREAARLQPGEPELQYHLADALRKLQKWAEAETVMRRLLRLRPEQADFHYKLGILCQEQRKWPQAIAAFQQALRLQPDYVQAANNLGLLLRDEKRFTEAEAAFRQALQARPDAVDVQWNLAILLLSLGRFQEGWSLYGARLLQSEHPWRIVPPGLPFPMWRGEPLAGRSLLVLPEQGFGDQIQFCRCLAPLKAGGASRITLVCPPALAPLFATLAGVDRLLPATPDMEYPPHDYWVHLLSIPGHLETMPKAIPYLRPPEGYTAKWRPLLAMEGLRVGLAWRGSPTHRNDANRSLPGLATLAPLWKTPNVVFIGLQKGAGEQEARQPPARQPLPYLGDRIGDFADTAAIIGMLDLVITIDSALAHLAGALGKPCWVMLPARGADWRWQHGRDDSVWYGPGLRLFRQSQAGSWSDVVRKMADELTRLTREMAAAWNDQGVQLAMCGRFPEAEAAFRQVLRIQPDHADALGNLGNLLQQNGRHAEAETAYREALRAQPRHAGAWHNLGNLLQARERYAEAETAYRNALRIQPGDVELHNNFGNLLHRQKRFAEAETAYRQALRLQPGDTRCPTAHTKPTR
ncbi:MAG: tetratricopeptide repeat protein, partial [Magnetococcales bacterium]|nr:tetratricopeptide repeat protein [Magnetococcales bacterium]